MSLVGRLKSPAADRAVSWLRLAQTNAAGEFARLTRVPSTGAKPWWHRRGVVVPAAAAAVIVIVLAMIFIDTAAVEAARRLPAWVSRAFEEVTEFGKSSWFLVPLGFLLVLVTVMASWPMEHASRVVLASVAVRLEFLFVAIAAPSLFTTVIKRLIGRARPLVSGHADPFLYKNFVWRPDYASLPSGHATTAFAAAIAIGLLWPGLRPLVWIYAVMIAISRVVLFAHHPSDVIAGALVGIAGVFIVRDWFAARRLGFVLEPDGTVHTLPGPSIARLKRVARALIAP